MQYLINNVEKVVVPEGTEAIQESMNFEGKEINLIISIIKEDRMFGGSFVKLVKKYCHKTTYISSSLSESELKWFVSGRFLIPYTDLMVIN